MVQIGTEVHMPTKGDAITCWRNHFGFIPIRFWPKTKSWASKLEEKRNHLAECLQYKNNPYCYQRFFFGQIAVRLPDQPGIQITHIGNKVVVMLIGKQPSAPVISAK
uniref:Uncharacterized protein n=1 Tax=Romanomermis culicivorax TaxID=13658 RepID=A0A915IKV6_ROMCU